MMNEINCPLCGYSYTFDKAHCSACPLNKSCNVVCCPHCSYQVVDDSKIREFFRRLGKWIKKKLVRMKS